jgi:signal transduction histidine kinase
MPTPVRVSLANKCQLLFGAAVVLILSAALAIGFARMQTLVTEGQQDTARRLADAWLDGLVEMPRPFASSTAGRPAPAGERPDDPSDRNAPPEPVLFMSLVNSDYVESAPEDGPVLAEAIKLFQTRDDLHEYFVEMEGDDGRAFHAYARAIRKSDLIRIRDRLVRQLDVAAVREPDASFAPGIDTTPLADPLRQVLLVKFRADLAGRQLTINRIYIVAAGLAAGLLAIGTFWFITTRIILSPVRVLRDTAEKIAEGDTNIRSDINTGDEFEQLSEVFNTMVERLKSNEDELRRSNKSLDLKLGELAQTNISLYEANKIKGEFLANVSHELRTPLNSIIGFAEVLEDTLRDREGVLDEKRKRYIFNIITSSRRLLDLINDLLDLAKIEAGRMDVRVEPVIISDAVEGLITLIRPQAEKNGVRLAMKVQRGLPVIHTDAGKVHQIIFNFLSNAVKFTPEGGTVTVGASLVEGPDAELRPGEQRVRIAVADTGPGIALDKQDKIFEKFTQLDTSVTRAHGGTGLGLTISRDLAKLLSARIDLDSDAGRGATFSLLLPLELTSRSVPLMPDLGGGPAA